MPAYVVAMMSIQDQKTYTKYTEQTPLIVKKYGGKFLTRGEEFTCVEGQKYDGRLVILEFPSKEHVNNWYQDPDYQQAMKFRHSASTMHYLLVQSGGDNTENPDPNIQT
ncbi:MAG: DUF1330 domain-containing protein [Granulosicoccus sp.]|nr:DUF1330 domain-containing protein [Granulosicoccus sp.]